MGEQGHDESVLAASQPVHTAPQKSNIPEAIKISQWQWFTLLLCGRDGWLYTTMIGNGPKQDRLLPYPLNTDEEDGDPVFFKPDTNAFFGMALREQKDDLATTKPTDLLWLDMDAKERHNAPEGEDLKQMPTQELKALVASQYHAFMEKCRVLGLIPFAVVYSGHGLQAYFRVERVLEIEETEAANRALAKRFAEFGADPKVYNAGRILRMPNTYNVKNPERPIKTELWWQA
ncbi:hypothetical protein ASF71_11780 [Deinococcus sp. Leaf326]|nr:hypothetical protein ASF71_11780 [Deinococcus sp. Leaf326]